MLTLGMLSPLTLLLAQTKNIGLLVSLLGSINLERQLFFGAALMFDETCVSFTWLFILKTILLDVYLENG